MASSAQAATVGISQTSVVYEHAPGEVDEPQLAANTVEIYVTQLSGVLTAGPGCSAGPDPNDTGGTRAVCPRRGVTAVVLRLGDGNDSFEPANSVFLPASLRFRLEAGPGTDEIFGTKYNDVLNGGSGRDLITGAGGKDTLIGGGGNDHIGGQGRLSGGAGNDFFELNGLPGSNFRSTVFGGGGNDAVISRNGARDLIDCGRGRKDRAIVTDNAFGRNLDTIRRNCESASRG